LLLGVVPWHSLDAFEAAVVIAGAVVSFIVNVAVVVDALPQSSVAVKMIVIVLAHGVPPHTAVAVLLLHVTLLPQRSLAAAAPLAVSQAT
jgi:hypothetical protein